MITNILKQEGGSAGIRRSSGISKKSGRTQLHSYMHHKRDH